MPLAEHCRQVTILPQHIGHGDIRQGSFPRGKGELTDSPYCRVLMFPSVMESIDITYVSKDLE